MAWVVPDSIADELFTLTEKIIVPRAHLVKFRGWYFLTAITLHKSP